MKIKPKPNSKKPITKLSLTNDFVEKLQAAKGLQVYRDNKVRGLELRVSPTGLRAFYFYYRTKAGTQRRPQLGRYPEMKVAEARNIASAMRVEIDKGNDPSGENKSKRAGLNVQDLMVRFLSDHVETRLKPQTQRDYKNLIANHINPKLGKLKLVDVSRADVSKVIHQLRDRQTTANRVHSVLHVAFEKGQEWGLMPEGFNPANRIKKYKEKPRKIYLTRSEIDRLAEVLIELEDKGSISQDASNAVRFLLASGWRVSEALGLKWLQVDMDNNIAVLPNTKIDESTRILTETAIGILKAIRSKSVSDYVFIGKSPLAPLTTLKKPWDTIRKAAQIEHVRLHDLRHTFASIGVGEGATLPQIGRFLGHISSVSTHRYAHLISEDAKVIGDKISKRFPVGISKGSSGEKNNLSESQEGKLLKPRRLKSKYRGVRKD